MDRDLIRIVVPPLLAACLIVSVVVSRLDDAPAPPAEAPTDPLPQKTASH